MSDSFRDAWEEAKARRGPKDVVHGGLTVDVLDSLNAATGQSLTLSEPGEVLLDVDGIPNAVGPTLTTTETLGGSMFSARQVRRLGMTVEQARTRWPNLTFIDSNEGDNTHD